uniref:Ras association domain family member 5 n=1 Tax=Canis lupus familiaris TaxID=9615 RepID=A0A8C0TA19_CANLF
MKLGRTDTWRPCRSRSRSRGGLGPWCCAGARQGARRGLAARYPPPPRGCPPGGVRGEPEGGGAGCPAGGGGLPPAGGRSQRLSGTPAWEEMEEEVSGPVPRGPRYGALLRLPGLEGQLGALQTLRPGGEGREPGPREGKPQQLPILSGCCLLEPSPGPARAGGGAVSLLQHPQSEDGTYTGFIKVHLKLRRPVTVPAGIRPQSIYDAIKEVNLAATTDKRTSFYLPLDAIKQLHISSTTTVSEVIQGLLKKFMVVDNPQKFALFKRIHKDGQVLFQKLSVADCPLYLRLLAGPDNDVLSFVLKENETGEVEVGLGPGACGTNQSSGRPGQVQVAVVLTPSVGGGRAAAMEAAGNMAWESQSSPGKGWALEV